MSKKNRNATSGKPLNASPVTHEPEVPQNWPDGHVRVELTGNETDECVKVWIHGYMHFLHATTARALQEKLEKALTEWNESKDAKTAILGVEISSV